VIIGIGADLVCIGRFRPWLAEPGLVERYFSAGELSELSGAPESRRAEMLAGKFAAKEALAKALGTGFRGLALRDMEVLKGEGGAPWIRATGTLAAALERLGAPAVQVTVSHEGDYALAFVVVESGGSLR
jgi:holo-[acyl-carrier protein] synthase